MLSVVPRPVIVRIPAKINLHLGVGDLREDGYHELETVFQAISLADEISIVSADRRSITVRGDNARAVPTDHHNLAWAAVDVFATATGHTGEVAIEITKGIPVAGGMAGGSADAAGVLLGLARLWRVDLSRDELSSLAADLGSDVPFALHGGTALGSGRGERLLSVLSRGEFHWVVAIAGGGLSTPDVYRELDTLRRNDSASQASPPDELLGALAAGDPRRLAPLLCNDLQPAAVSLMPALRRTLRAGADAGATAGIVSGSGPTCVFLCTDSDHAVDVAAELSGAGVCRSVRIASGPVPGARLVEDDQ